MAAERVCPDCGTDAVTSDGVCEKCGRLVSHTEKTKRRFAIGDVVDGRYEIVANLPTGGMGELYKVRHAHLGDFRVIKFLRSDQLADPTLLKRFIQEAKLAASIKHRNVASLFDFASLPDGSYYMVQEFIEGTSIASFIHHGGRFTASELMRITVDVLRGLVAIHAAGIIHRDVSPDNLMLTHSPEGEPLVKIIDLGIARPAEGAGLTTAGFFVGKPHYASPEQMRVMETDQKLDQRSDLYSLGVVLFEMVVGRVPFEAATPLAYLLRQLQEEIRTINTDDVANLVPPEVDEFIVKLLKVNRDERFQSAVEALAAAESIRGRLPGAPPIAAVTPTDSTSEFAIQKTQPQMPSAVLSNAPTEPQRRSAQNEIPTQVLGKDELTAPEQRTAPGRTRVDAAPTIVGAAMPSSDVDPYRTQPGRGQTATFDVSTFSRSAETIDKTREVAQMSVATASPVVPIRDDASLPTMVESIMPPPPTIVQPEPLLPTYAEPPTVAPSVIALSQTRPRQSGALWLVLGFVVIAIVAVAAGGGLFVWRKLHPAPTAAPAVAQTTTQRAPDVALQPAPIAPVPSGVPLQAAPPLTTVPPMTETTATAPPPTRTPIEVKRKPKAVRPVAPPPTETVAAVETTAPEPEPDPLPKEGEIVAAGADVTEPQILKQATPRYPPAAARMRASGRAVISVLVGPNGRVQATKVIKSTGNPFLDDAATSAARDTTFSPPTKRGVRVSMYTVMSFDFALPR